MVKFSKARFTACLFIFFSNFLYSKILIESTNFTIYQDGQRYILTVRNPWKNSRRELVYYFLPRGMPGDKNSIHYPVERIVTTASPYIAHLKAVDCLERVVGHDRVVNVYDKEIVKLFKIGKIKGVSLPSGVLDLEKVIFLKPEVVVAYAVNASDFDRLSRLNESGIKVLIESEWLEESPLDRSKWLAVTSLLCGNTTFEKALQIVKLIENNYYKIVNTLPKPKKKLIVTSGAPYRGIWFAPGGNSLVAKMFRDLKVQYVWDGVGDVGSISLDPETAFIRSLKADFWLNPMPFDSKQEIISSYPFLTRIKAFLEDRVYTNTKRVRRGGGNDFWETGSYRVDIILNDLAQIFYYENDSKLFFYKKLQ